jgi:hypothetical protein
MEAQRYILLIQYLKIRRNQPVLHNLTGLLLSKEPVIYRGLRINSARTVLSMKANRKFPAHASKNLWMSKYFPA